MVGVVANPRPASGTPSASLRNLLRDADVACRSPRHCVTPVVTTMRANPVTISRSFTYALRGCTTGRMPEPLEGGEELRPPIVYPVTALHDGPDVQVGIGDHQVGCPAGADGAELICDA